MCEVSFDVSEYFFSHVHTHVVKVLNLMTLMAREAVS